MEIKIVRNVLEKNKKLADNVREILKSKKQSMFNFMSSPGSGKTLLLENLIPILLNAGYKVGVIEGDVTTLNDAQRLQHLNIPIAMINTEKFGGTCHLASNVILGAMEEIKSDEIDIVIIENVGNLICPSEYDTGSDINVVLLSTTEGEDKPLKYPRIFQKTEVAIINKIDIAEVLGVDLNLIQKNIQQINPNQIIFQTSAKTKQGLDDLAKWMIEKHKSIITTLN